MRHPEQIAKEIVSGLEQQIAEAIGDATADRRATTDTESLISTRAMRIAALFEQKEATKSEERLSILREILSEFVDAATANEQHDIGLLVDNLTRIYEWASGGVVSKPFTDPQEVISLAEARIAKETDEDIAEAVTRAMIPMERVS